MQKYKVTGMHCAACSARVEKAVSAVEGVTSCAVNLLTNSMVLEGDAGEAEVIRAVEAAGYGAVPFGKEKKPSAEKEELSDRETPMIARRLWVSLVFLLVLMYVSMGHMMLALPLPPFFTENPLAIALLELLLSAAVLVINQKFFINGVRGLIKRAPNMDTLVALGSGVSFLYSTFLVFQMTRAENVHEIVHGLYFESAAMILVLITVGKMLEARAKGKTTNAIKSLMEMAPRTAVVLENGNEKEVAVETLRVGDLFIVKSGAAVPVDGRIEEGHGSVDESALTGESMPVEKEAGAAVSAGTVCRTGYLLCRATGVGEDTTLSKIIQMVSDATMTRAPIAKMADRVSGIFVPVVLGIAVCTAALWLLFGKDIGFALTKAISVLVISCPCALGLATPVAIMVGSGVGAKSGILFKTAAALEEAGRIRTVAFDKTGTITKGHPVLTDILPVGDIEETEILTLAYALEHKSEHPVAIAICEAAKERGLSPLDTENFEVLPGGGVSARVNGSALLLGNLRFVSKTDSIVKIEEHVQRLTDAGKTPLFLTKDGKICGILAVRDMVREDSAAAIDALRKMGIRTVMLTGDTEKTAKAVAESVGIDEVFAALMPAEKEETIRTLSEKGHVAMVGDGINDAPALTAANLGVAIGRGTDIAIEAADVVLTKSTLLDVVGAIRLGRGVLRNIRENLFWAFIYNIIGIPVAAGALYPIWGITLSPMLGAAAMSISSFSVVSNALRLNFLKLQNKEKETENMEKILKVEGMMCPHCEARVQKCLEEIDGVTKAVCSHENGTATVTLSKEVSDATLREAVEAAGYPVLEM